MQEDQETPSSPHFELPIERVVVRFGHGERCELQSVDRTHPLTDEDAESVAGIANQDLIYHRLFRKRFNGQPFIRNLFINELIPTLHSTATSQKRARTHQEISS